MMGTMRHSPIPFSECVAMVAFLFLFAPAVVLIAVLIMQRFQPSRDQNPETLIERIVKGSRVEPRFSAFNDETEHEPDSGMSMDRHPTSTG
jgi:hypothetical protein